MCTNENFKIHWKVNMDEVKKHKNSLKEILLTSTMTMDALSTFISLNSNAFHFVLCRCILMISFCIKHEQKKSV